MCAACTGGAAAHFPAGGAPGQVDRAADGGARRVRGHVCVRQCANVAAHACRCVCGSARLSMCVWQSACTRASTLSRMEVCRHSNAGEWNLAPLVKERRAFVACLLSRRLAVSRPSSMRPSMVASGGLPMAPEGTRCPPPLLSARCELRVCE
eukprot:364208-Chlamydomonas_euryale.AAC.19